MQIDMHYYGTFAMAHAAGLSLPHAQILATSAQLVDDNNFDTLHELSGGQAIMGVATAHHPLDAGKRTIGFEFDDCRTVWVPFHFLPGNVGDTFEKQMVCTKNSDVAQAMMAHYTEKETVNSHRGHILQLMGIASHVYADTFSHYGFSGIASRLNGITVDSIKLDDTHSKNILKQITSKALAFKDSFSAAIAGTVQLGHGAAATYPDRPYLKWSYTDLKGHKVDRNNPETFLEACAALYEFFCRFKSEFSKVGEPVMPFEKIQAAVKDVLSTEQDAAGRTSAWKLALAKGRIGPVVQVPDYSPTNWIETLKSGETLSFDKGRGRVNNPAHGFFAAADYHRNYVLKRLLPEVGLFVA